MSYAEREQARPKVNELDTYAEVKGLDTQAIISGVGLDPRGIDPSRASGQAKLTTGAGTHYNRRMFLSPGRGTEGVRGQTKARFQYALQEGGKDAIAA